MRSITVTMWVTLDGVVQGLGRADEDTRGGFTHGGWGAQYDDEVMGREMAKGMSRPGDMLFGRRTWHAQIAVEDLGVREQSGCRVRQRARDEVREASVSPAAHSGGAR